VRFINRLSFIDLFFKMGEIGFFLVKHMRIYLFLLFKFIREIISFLRWTWVEIFCRQSEFLMRGRMSKERITEGIVLERLLRAYVERISFWFMVLVLCLYWAEFFAFGRWEETHFGDWFPVRTGGLLHVSVGKCWLRLGGWDILLSEDKGFGNIEFWKLFYFESYWNWPYWFSFLLLTNLKWAFFIYLEFNKK